MAASQTVKFPIQLYGLHARYANALYSAAVKSGTLKKVETDLAQVKTWLNEKPAFKTYLKNPIVQRSEKKVDMDKISKGMNDTTRGFLMILAENGRLADLEKVLNTFDRLIDAERGVVKATVTSAEALDEKTVKSVKEQLAASFLQKGQTLHLDSKVEPAILGGFQVQVGDKFLDLSVATKINNIAKTLAVQSA